MPPAIDVIPHPQHFGFNDCTAGFLCTKICTRQEDHANSDQIIVRLVPCATDLVIEKLHRNLNVNASAVAGFPVCIHSTTMPNGFQRGDAVINNLTAWFTINGNHKPYTTGGMLVILAVKPVFGQIFACNFVFSGPFFVILGHTKISEVNSWLMHMVTSCDPLTFCFCSLTSNCTYALCTCCVRIVHP